MFSFKRKKINGQSNIIAATSRSQPSSPFKGKFLKTPNGPASPNLIGSSLKHSSFKNNNLYNNNSLLAYHALKFTWAVEILIGSLMEGHKCEVNKRTGILLEETGEELYQFLGIPNSLSTDHRHKMAMSFIQFLKLAITHSNRKSNSIVIEWSNEMKTSWIIFLLILLTHLEDSGLDY